MSSRLLLLLCSLILVGWHVPATAQVHKCQMPGGSVIYTDRTCASLGAIERRPRGGNTSNAPPRLYQGGCARNLQDLLYEATTAIDSGDVNRLAALYHWPGISTPGSIRIMRRLDAIVQRPLVDIAVLRRAKPATRTASPAMAELAAGAYVPPPPPDADPVSVKLQQVQDGSATPKQTTFGLRRHVGCWWLRF